jgi:hypothetical protein
MTFNVMTVGPFSVVSNPYQDAATAHNMMMKQYIQGKAMSFNTQIVPVIYWAIK